jgi:hypothetical protein
MLKELNLPDFNKQRKLIRSFWLSKKSLLNISMLE